MSRHRFLWLACITLLSFPLSLSAQTTTGTVRGYLKDPSGTAITDGDVQARNTETGVQRSATTLADGSYILAGLTPGTYELSARRIGSTPQRRQVVVQIGATLFQDFTLQAGAVELQAVTVEGTSVETRTSEVATNVSPSQVANLPTVDRNFLDLAALAPGVAIQNQRLDAQRRTFSAGAQNPEAINVFIDGASYKNDVLQGGVAGQDASRGNPFPLNAVREFRILTQNFKAEYQKASSAIIAATTQSGTNQWQGNAFYFGMGQGFIARDPFLSPSASKPEFRRTLLGASVGGPLIKDRLHLFASYEGNYQNRFANVGLDTLPADTVNFRPFNGTFLQPFRETLLFGKLSYQLKPGQSLELSVNTRHETDIRSFGGQTSYQTAENVQNDVTTGTLKHQATWGNWLNEATATMQWYHWNPVAINPTLIGRNYFGKGRIGGKDTEQDFEQKRIALRNDLTYSGFHWKGDHVAKIGLNADFLNYHVDKFFNANPVFNYSSDTVDGHYAAAWQAPFQAQYGFGNPDLSTHNTQFGVYLQDDWSPSRRLIINAGIRWDYESDMLDNNYVTPQNIRDSIQSPTFRDSVLFPIPSSYFTNGSQRPAYTGAFQPRLGFSYALDDEGITTLFGGFGVFYDRDYYNATLDERFRLQYSVLTFRFSSNGLPDRNGFPTIQWNDQYLSKAGLDSLAASGLAPKPEAYLIDNSTRPPHSSQWSLGVRRVLGNYTLSATYTGVRSYNGLTYIFGNRRLNGNCCYQNANLPFSNVIISSDQVRTWYDALYVKIERPYRGGHTWAWGGGLSYSYGKAQAIGGDLFSFDYVFPNEYPKHPTTSDERHHIVGNWILDMPLDIQFSGLLTLGSGTPFVTSGPGIQPNASYAFPAKQSFIIPHAFAFRDLDARLSKSLTLSGTHRVELRAEGYNLLNFKNYGCFEGFRPSASFGKPNCAVTDARYAQLGAQYTF
ncbi:MAG TPA: carboxypeptidase regulatory-like domain-containing protein [Gemmatimonadaceae bacterium]